MRVGGLAMTDRPGVEPPLVWGHGLLSSMAHEDAAGPLRWEDVGAGGAA